LPDAPWRSALYQKLFLLTRKLKLELSFGFPLITSRDPLQFSAIFKGAVLLEAITQAE
jgi:hypothetical protein